MTDPRRWSPRALAAALALLLLTAFGAVAGIAGAAGSATGASCAADSYDGSTLTLHCAVARSTVTKTVTKTVTAPTPTPTTPTPPPSGFPTAATTGTTGTLAKYTGPLNITTAGTTVQNVEIDGCVTIAAGADNVTFRNVLIKSGSCYQLLLNSQGATGLQVIDSELDGQGNATGDSGIAGANYSLLRVNLHGTVDGGKLGDNVSVTDSYVHDEAVTSTTHNDGFQSLGSVGVTIRHNSIITPAGGTSAVILSTGSADQIRNVTVDGNLLAGGAYTVYGGYRAGTDDASKVSGIKVINNQFSTQINPNGGVYGPLTSCDPPAVTVSGNTWFDGPKKGQPVN